MDPSGATAASAGSGTAATITAFCTTTRPARGLKTEGVLGMDHLTQPNTRTLAHAVADVRYGIVYGSLNERFWQRADTTLNLVQILFGALALTGALAASGILAAVAGVVLACVSAVQLTLQPGRRSFEFREARRQFHELAAQAWSMPLAEVDQRLEQLRYSAPNGLAALARPAQEMVDAAHGHPPRWPRLGLVERLAKALA